MIVVCAALGSRGDVQPIALIVRALLDNPEYSSSISKVYFVTHYEHKSGFLDELFHIDQYNPEPWSKHTTSSTATTANKVDVARHVSPNIYEKIKFAFCHGTSPFLSSSSTQTRDTRNSKNVIAEWKQCCEVVDECLQEFKKTERVQEKGLLGICSSFSFPAIFHLFVENLGNFFIICPSPSHCTQISDNMSSCVPEIIARLKRNVKVLQTQNKELRHSSETFTKTNQSYLQDAESSERDLKRLKTANEKTSGTYESVLNCHIQAYLWILFTDHYDVYLTTLTSMAAQSLEDHPVIRKIEEALCMPWIDAFVSKLNDTNISERLPQCFYAHGNNEDICFVLPGHTNIQRIGFVMQADADVEMSPGTHQSKGLQITPANSENSDLFKCFLKKRVLPNTKTLIINFGSMSNFVDWEIIVEAINANEELVCIIVIPKGSFENVLSQSKHNFSQWQIYEAYKYTFTAEDRKQQSNTKAKTMKTILVGSVDLPQLLKTSLHILHQGITKKDQGSGPATCNLVLMHHGGAGTTAAATKHSVLQLVYPLGFDQTYWAAYIQKMHLGFSIKHLTVSSLQGSICKIFNQRQGDPMSMLSTHQNHDTTLDLHNISMPQQDEFNGLQIAVEKIAKKLNTVPSGTRTIPFCCRK